MLFNIKAEKNHVFMKKKEQKISWYTFFGS